MTLTETIEILRSANPEQDEVQAPPLAALIGRLDTAGSEYSDALVGSPRERQRRRTVLRAALVAGCLAVIALVVVASIGGSGGRGLSVAAAVERAITPGPGVLHILTESESVAGGHVINSGRSEIWSTENPRRQRVHDTLHSNGEVVEGEGALLSVKPPRTVSWSPSQPDVIRESTAPVSESVKSPVAWLREAYEQGRLHVIGRTEENGRAAWTLDVQRSQPAQSLEGHLVPAPTVIVDADTFVPLENVVYSVNSEGAHKSLETETTRYLAYEELPVTPANEALLQLASHPGAKVVTEPSS